MFIYTTGHVRGAVLQEPGWEVEDGLQLHDGPFFLFWLVYVI